MAEEILNGADVGAGYEPCVANEWRVMWDVMCFGMAAWTEERFIIGKIHANSTLVA
jgi:hypothetical protein